MLSSRIPAHFVGFVHDNDVPPVLVTMDRVWTIAGHVMRVIDEDATGGICGAR
jgi:hypothetical protein